MSRLSPFRLSLSQRLSLAATIVLLVFLGAMAAVLDSAFGVSLDSIMRDKLQLHTHNLLRRADVENGKFILPRYISEPAFNQSQGNLIALVRKPDSNGLAQEQWRSLSAGQQHYQLPIPEAGQWLYGRAKNVSGAEFFVASRTVLWPNENGVRIPFVISVLENTQNTQQQYRDSRYIIGAALAALGVILLALQLLIFRFGLTPLRQLSDDLSQLNQGQANKLDGDYPKELRELTDNLNVLLDNERRQRQRYQDRMADLSHSLKTPLSILRGIERDTDTDGQPLQRQVIISSLNQQIGRMSEIIEYQLQRAVTSGDQASFIAIDIATEAAALVGALAKVYIDKQVDSQVNIEPGLSVFADENDFAEILGNLMDNAFKHCQHQVKLSAQQRVITAADLIVELIVEDDGLGIPETQRARILKRGVRLDTTTEGQGFGLAIVVEILNSYQGELLIEHSPLGGAKFIARLPAGKKHTGIK